MCLRLTSLFFTLFNVTASVFAAESVDYVRDVYPILEKHCIACHTADEAQGGLVMETYPSLMRGGDSGPALTAGAPMSSRLYMMASGKLEPVMPPDDAERPSDDELATIANWIEQGAKGPGGEVAMRRELHTPIIKTSEDAKLPVTAVSLSPDGVTQAVARYGEVRLLAGDSSLPNTIIVSQPGKVNSLRFNADGSKLLIASGITGLNGRASVYDVATGKNLLTIDGHTDVIQTAIFSPDEKTIATASYDRSIRLWDSVTGEQKQQFVGHNGAIYSLAFSPDNKVLVSGCADQTVKVWDVVTGKRLDTMSQPTDEVLTVAVAKDGSFVVSGSADNRLRVWKLVSRDKPRINPLIATRFIDESPLTHLAITEDGTRLVVVSEAGNVKVLRTDDWNQAAVLDPVGDTPSDLTLSTDGKFAMISLMNGEIVKREIPLAISDASSSHAHHETAPVYLDLGELPILNEASLRKEQGLSDATGYEQPVVLGRGGEVAGMISVSGEEDWFSFNAREGEMWAIETDTRGLGSSLDSVLEIRDDESQPIVQVRLQATRDSYFTFRGKDSTQTGDFRIFNWEEMKLDEYLYSSGEVVRLWLSPRGADSGFDVYPGEGKRWTYFGTSGTVHALGEPAYIVRPLSFDEKPVANGLPVFDVYFINDDEPSQSRGKDSYVLFQAPQTGKYLIRVRDTRGQGGDSYSYRLRLRPATPGFNATVAGIKAPLKRGSGREVKVLVDRLDGYDGEVWFEIEDLPAGIHSNFPVCVEPGQGFAVGNIWANIDAESWQGELQPRVTARATIHGKVVERDAGVVGKLTLADHPNAVLKIVTEGSSTEESGTPIVRIRRGETISLLVTASRAEGFTNEIPLGKEQAGRNLPHGVYVDNIGLNGLLIRENESERPFFITADSVAELGTREFFLTGAIDGNVTSPTVLLEVVP
jgi:WD40 repeat protein